MTEIRLLIKHQGARAWSTLNAWPQDNAKLKALEVENPEAAASFRLWMQAKARRAKDGWWRHYYRHQDASAKLRLVGA